MNLFGVGNLELVWILVIAVIVLGPGRMVEAAKIAGKYWREAQHTLRAAADAATVDLDAPSRAKAPPRTPEPEPEDAVPRNPGAPSEDPQRPGDDERA